MAPAFRKKDGPRTRLSVTDGDGLAGGTQLSIVEAHVLVAKPDMGTVFEEYFDYVWHTLRHLGVRDCDLEDLAQDVFLRVCARIEDYDSAKPMRPWLFGFAFRVAADYRRLARHRLEVRWVPPERADPERPVDQRIDVEEQRKLVLRALDRIDFERRAILVMHDVDEIPVPAIADEFGIPVNTAYSRLRLAREELAQAVVDLESTRGAS